MLYVMLLVPIIYMCFLIDTWKLLVLHACAASKHTIFSNCTYMMCCNFTCTGGSKSVAARDVMRADAAPLEIDPSVTWDSIGGLNRCVHIAFQQASLRYKVWSTFCTCSNAPTSCMVVIFDVLAHLFRVPHRVPYKTPLRVTLRFALWQACAVAEGNGAAATCLS